MFPNRQMTLLKKLKQHDIIIVQLVSKLTPEELRSKDT